MVGRGCRIGALVLAALIAAPAAAHAAATWLAPLPPISAAGQSADWPKVAMDAQGNALAVWYRSDGSSTRIEFAFRPAGGTFTTAVPISAPGATSWFPDLAVDGQGNAVAVWRRVESTGLPDPPVRELVQAAYRPAGGDFGPPQTLQPVGSYADMPRVVMDAAGNALVMWAGPGDGGTVLRAAFRPAGGTFGDAEPVSGPGHIDQQFDVAFDRQGNALAVWGRKLSGDNNVADAHLEAAFRPAGGSFGDPETVSTATKVAGSSQLAFDGDGNAVVVYLLTGDQPVIDPWPFRIYAALRPAGGSFGDSQPLSVTTDRAASLPDVAMDAQGNAVAVWMEGFYTYAAARAPGGSFATGKRISPLATNSYDPRVGFDANGEAVAMWTNGDANGLAVMTARRAAGAADFGEPQRISAYGTESYSQHRMAFDAQGDAVALWRRSDGSDKRIEVAGYDGAPPLLRDVSIPDTGLVGAALSFGVDAFDVWSPFSTAWAFGDGASADGPSASHAYGTAGNFDATVTATDALGNAASATRTVTVTQPTPSPTPTPTPTGTSVDTTAPALSAVRLSPARFRAAPSGASIAAAKVGTTVRYTLSEAARVTLTVERVTSGRRVRGACRRVTAKNRRKARCARYVAVKGEAQHDGVQGTNRFIFRGRLANRKLKAGRYRLVLQATDPAGNRSPPRRAPFRIVAR